MGRKKRFIVRVIIFMCLLFGSVGQRVFASEVTHNGTFNGVYLLCYSKCVATYGKASTSGATKPLGNYAAVVIYGQNNASQGTISKIQYSSGTQQQAAGAAVATKYGSDLKSAKTYHAVVNADGSFTASFLEQLVYTVEK